MTKKHKTKKLKITKDTWKISAIALGILLIVSIFTSGFTSFSLAISKEAAAEKALDFINANLLQPGTTAEVLDVKKDKGLYNLQLDIAGRTYDSYITTDGKLLFPSAIPLEAVETSIDDITGQAVASNVQKSDKPVVELFIMTHCPYGTQMEKGILPVIGALGDKADIKIRFVHYFMHAPEETETPVQVCIREEQSDKFNDYLSCFLKEGDSESCLTETGIDIAKLDTCIVNNADSYYAEDSSLSQGYGVQGSPGLVVNGAVASSGRDPASILATVCAAFNNAPDECSAELSSEAPSPGFGYNPGSATTASCG